MKLIKSLGKPTIKTSLLGLVLLSPILFFALSHYFHIVATLGKLSNAPGLSLSDAELRSGVIKMIAWTPLWAIPLVLIVRFGKRLLEEVIGECGCVPCRQENEDSKRGR